jgi:alpha-maltose-1-phosphate synthase
MRVLFVNENIGGHATVHHNLERALEDHPEVEAEFLHAPPPRLPRRLVGATVPGLGRLDLDVQALRSQLALSTVVRRRLRPVIGRFDCVHVYTQNAALLSAGLLRSVPAVVSLDSTNAQNAFQLPQRHPTRFTARQLPLTQWFERKVYDAATVLAPSSAWCGQSLRSVYSVPAEKIRTLRFGVPVVDPLPPTPEPSGLPEITFVGRDLERKGGNKLVELHQRFLADRCVLNLVTRDEVAPRRNVRVYDDVRPGDGKLDPLLRGSRAFVFPSEIDKSPNSVLEAMADGVPVVALRVNGLPDMVDPGVTGLLLEPGDDAGLVDAIVALLDHRDLAARMGAAGHRRAVDQFEIGATTARLLDTLEEARRRWVPREPAERRGSAGATG